MLAISVVSYELVTSSEARSTVDVIETVGAGVTAKTVATAPLVIPREAPPNVASFESISDTAVLLASGTTLLAVAAGMRRRAP